MLQNSRIIMVELLSQLSRKPSKASHEDLERSGWNRARARVIQHLESDPVLDKLFKEFTVANNKLKHMQSKRDLKIYFIEQERAGTLYTYARCFFMIAGKQKEFRKYIGKTDDLKENHIDHAMLKSIFLNMLKNHETARD